MAKWKCDHCEKVEENNYQTRMPVGWSVIRFQVREQSTAETDIRETGSIKFVGTNRICSDCSKVSRSAAIDDQKLTIVWKLKTYEEMFEKQKSKKEVAMQNAVFDANGLGALKT